MFVENTLNFILASRVFHGAKSHLYPCTWCLSKNALVLVENALDFYSCLILKMLVLHGANNHLSLIKILGLKRKMGLGFSPMVLCVVQRLCALTFFRPYRTLHLLLISKAEISHEHCERTVVFLEPLSFCQQREVTKSLQLKSRCV